MASYIRRMTVIMNKSDYIDKANTLLNDTETYQQLETDPRMTTVNRINQKLKQLKDQDKRNETIYHRIRPNDATTAKFYESPKIQKRKHFSKTWLLSPYQDLLHTNCLNILP